VIVPAVVPAELSHELAPAPVQSWVAAKPAWLEVEDSPPVALAAGIHKGEAAAIAWAARLHADLLLMDDRKGVIAA
jgi:predicted nucleic acid-binding protein